MTVWLGNLIHKYGEENDSFPELDSFFRTLHQPPCDLIVVTNEVGMGIVPDNPLARRYRDLAGALNARIAETADQVILTVCGIPTVIKNR